jgi:hypothetical protein
MPNFNQFYNGIGASAKDQSTFPSLVNTDVHSIPGAVTCSRAFTNLIKTDATPRISAKTPNGDTFWANNQNGKIWKESNGVVTLVYNNPDGKHFAMHYYRGYLYFASSAKLGRIEASSASSETPWTSQNNAYASFYNENVAPFTMATCRGKLIIPNRNYLAMISYLGAFTPNALDFLNSFTIKATITDGNVVICLADDGVQTVVFTWDTLESTWLWEDYVYEVGANMFLKLDNEIGMQIGSIGNIYKWSGRQAVLYGRLMNNGVISTYANPYGANNLNGLPLIATPQGIYTLGKANVNFPEAQVIEYTPSKEGAHVYGVQVRGNDIICSWSTGSEHGIDKLGNTYATAVITTPESYGKNMAIWYDHKGGDITAQIKKDDGVWQDYDLADKSDSTMTMQGRSDFSPKKRVQGRIRLIPNGADCPIIDNITIG